MKMSGKVTTEGTFLSYWTCSLKWHSREGPLKQYSHMILSLVESLEYYPQFGSPRPVAVGSYHSVPFMSKRDRRLERKRAAVFVVMLCINQPVQGGFVVVYTDGSSKEVDLLCNCVRIGGWGWTDMVSREQSRRIPRELHQTNSVGELLAALDAAQTFSQSPKVVLVTDSTYVRNGFSSVCKWCLNGWLLPCGQQLAHREMSQEILQVLDEMGPRLQVLWCPSYEGIPGNERTNAMAESGTTIAESEVRLEAAPHFPSSLVIFAP